MPNRMDTRSNRLPMLLFPCTMAPRLPGRMAQPLLMCNRITLAPMSVLNHTPALTVNLLDLMVPCRVRH